MFGKVGEVTPIKDNMTLYNIPNMTGGMDNTLVEVASTVHTFVPGFLFFIFFVVLLSGYSTQKRRDGYGDIQAWTLMASLSVFILSLIMTIKPGLIDITVLGVVCAVTLFAGVWFFLSRGRGEE
jgi:hypothetical protein